MSFSGFIGCFLFSGWIFVWEDTITRELEIEHAAFEGICWKR
jgi:hypothetical protein